jgi:hypothetical protein
MSVKVLNYSDVAESSRTAEVFARTTIRYGTRDYGSSGDISSFEIRPALESKVPARKKPTEKVVRRLNGFLVEDKGEEYEVAFVEKGNQLVIYYLPARHLRKAGITAPNQPFQMDEVEIELDGGRVMTGYVFCPLASRSDSFIDAIELTEDRKRKFSAIVEKFGKPKT